MACVVAHQHSNRHAEDRHWTEQCENVMSQLLTYALSPNELVKLIDMHLKPTSVEVSYAHLRTNNMFVYDSQCGRVAVSAHILSTVLGLKNADKFLSIIQNDNTQIPQHLILSIIPCPDISYGWIAINAEISEWQASRHRRKR